MPGFARFPVSGNSSPARSMLCFGGVTMPITVSCSCGKQLRAKDESAGKKIRCPGCGSVLSVPAAEEEILEEEAPPVPAKPIVVSCSCGKKLQVRAELAGKAVKCPGCGKSIKVPGPAANGPRGL